MIVVTISVDSTIVKTAAFTGGLDSPEFDVAVFAVMVLILAVGQFVIFRIIGKMEVQSALKKRLLLTQTHKWVSIVLYLLVGILTFIVLQMVLTSVYSLLLVEFAVCVSCVLASALLAFLSVRLLSWFRLNHKAIVLAYLLATLAVSINAAFTLFYVSDQLMDIYQSRGTYVNPGEAFVGNYNKLYDIFEAGYDISYVTSFALMWAATVLMLRNYSKKLGTVRYWLLVSIPLLYFLSQFGYAFLDLFTTFRVSHPVLFGVTYTLFFSGAVPAGGILFAVAFWSIARSLTNNLVKQYMMVTAYGIMILFSSNQASALVRFFYPPFGLVTVSFFGLASYLLLRGIYSAVMSVAQDSDLRRSIRQSAEEQAGILREIGTSQMENEIRDRVNAVTANLVAKAYEMNEQTGISPSLEEEDIKEYLKQVVEEIRKSRP